ncbi:MAG: hypothetical protein K2Y22_16590 [Candidatus Obscuribacterales bacterium]|nr:hypothetical protein [Candidatus Obscuribacterales bacterium]
MKAQLLKSQISLMAASLLLCPILQAFSPAYAFRLSVGTVQAEKRLEPAQPTPEDVNDPTYDLTESPCVVSMIKLLAHYLPQQVYFLNSEPQPNYPSINIISLLIKIAAASRPLDKPLVIRKELNLPPPVIKTENTTNQPKAKTKPDKKTGKLSIGEKTPALDQLDPEATVKKEQERKNRSIASESLYDSKNLEAKPTEETVEHNKIKTANLYSDFMAPTVHLNPPKENMQFLFWTCPADTNSANGAQDMRSSAEIKFEGSFVVSQQGARFKSIHGRQFTLDEGKLLACNRQAELSFITPFGLVSLPAGTSAFLTLDKNTLSVQAVESSGKSIVAISVKDGKRLFLASGQQLVLSADGKPAISQFSISQLTEKERLFNSQASYLNQQQASALSELMKRITASTTAAGSNSR